MGTGDIRDDEGASEETLVSGIVVPDDLAAVDFVRPYQRPIQTGAAPRPRRVLSERIRSDSAHLSG
jgi:hypothetical protein